LSPVVWLTRGRRTSANAAELKIHALIQFGAPNRSALAITLTDDSTIAAQQSRGLLVR
jgi:hypothetical protein